MHKMLELVREYSAKIARIEKKHPTTRPAGIIRVLSGLYSKRSGIIEAASCLGVSFEVVGFDSDGVPEWGARIITEKEA